jgi:hypothetical protein
LVQLAPVSRVALTQTAHQAAPYTLTFDQFGAAMETPDIVKAGVQDSWRRALEAPAH